jgi:integrase
VRASRLIEQARRELKLRHYSRRTNKAYTLWIRRFLKFHEGREASSLGQDDVTAFLTSLAVDLNVSASTQNQALSAILFLYRVVLRLPLPWLDEVVRAKRPKRLPVVLSREEVRRVLDRLEGLSRLIAMLPYGSGMRLLECCELRVKDVDFDRNEITVRAGKGRKDRMTMLPLATRAPFDGTS